MGFDDDTEENPAIQTFSNFLQGQMNQKFNQLLVPQSLGAADNFGFYLGGKDLWKQGFNFREETEDKFRL